MLWFLRPDVKQLNALENEFNKLDISDFLIPTYSYVSIVELSNYLAGDSNEDPYENPRKSKIISRSTTFRIRMFLPNG